MIGFPKSAKLGIAIAAVALGLPTWLFLSGAILLKLIHVPMRYYRLGIWLRYFGDYPQLRDGPLAVSGFLSAGVLILPVLLLLHKRPRSTYGVARFANERQIRKAGLMSDTGIIVGKRGSRFLVFGGQQHVLMAAPTRSGKGVGIVIPNLLNWPDSVVVLDIKQENWDLTAGYRATHGQPCFLFNPAAADRRTHRFNPLGYVSDDPAFRINSVQKIANMLYPDLPNVDPIWNASCRSLFVGIVLYLIETPSLPRTLGQVLRCTLTRIETAKHFTNIIDARAKTSHPLSLECQTALNDYIGVTSENTRSSIKKTFTSRLELWLNPVVDAATSANDFDLRELRTRRMSVYIGITPDNLDRLQPIVNLLFQIALDANTQQLPQQNPALKYSCLMLMDEFTAIGKINVLAKGIGYIAGYNLRMLPIIQSPAQIREVYGKDGADTFIVNHALQIVFAPREFAVCKEISDSLGYDTIKGRSESKGKGFFVKKMASQSSFELPRALLLPQEVRDIGPTNSLLLTEGTPPIQCKKIYYYREKIFKERLMRAPAVPLLEIRTQLELVHVEPAVSTRTARPSVSETTNSFAVSVSESSLAALLNLDRNDDFLNPGADQPDLYTVPLSADRRSMTDESNAETMKDDLDDLDLDFSRIEIPADELDEDKMRSLHAVFMIDQFGVGSAEVTAKPADPAFRCEVHQGCGVSPEIRADHERLHPRSSAT